MNRTFLTLLLLTVLSSTNRVALANTGSKIEKARSTLVELRSELVKYNITELEIMQFEPSASFPAAVDPEFLRRSCDYKLLIKRINNKPYFKELQIAMEDPILSQPTTFEIRTGIIFYKGEKKAGEVYFDETGFNAIINGVRVSWKDDPLYQWFKLNFGQCFRY